MSEGWKHGGWKDKYIVAKRDGTPVDPGARYFVLRWDKDPHARVAMEAYARSVHAENPQFADDIITRLDDMDCDEFVAQYRRDRLSLEKGERRGEDVGGKGS